jgi:hypothetical protein
LFQVSLVLKMNRKGLTFLSLLLFFALFTFDFWCFWTIFNAWLCILWTCYSIFFFRF